MPETEVKPAEVKTINFKKSHIVASEHYNRVRLYSDSYLSKIEEVRFHEIVGEKKGLPFYGHKSKREPIILQENDAWTNELNTRLGELTPVPELNSTVFSFLLKMVMYFLRYTGLMQLGVFTVWLLPQRTAMGLAKYGLLKEIVRAVEIMPPRRAVALLEYASFEATVQITLLIHEKRMLKLANTLVEMGYTSLLGRIVDSSPDLFFIKNFSKLGEKTANDIMPHIQRPERLQLARQLGQSIDSLPVALSELMQSKTALEVNNSRLSDAVRALEISKAKEERKTQQLNETVQKLEELTRRIRQYVPSQLVDSLLGEDREEKTAHKRKKLTVFFSDICNFTEIADNIEAETLAEFLNSYLDEMSNVANRYGGTIDKFIGDAIVIFFGDPTSLGAEKDARQCVEMALEMKSRLEELRAIWSRKGFDKPWQVRMGINTGYCTVGDFGSDKRKDYTIIGREVNLASRLETAAEPDTILASHSTMSLVSDHFVFNEKGELKVKGFQKPVKVYQVLESKTQQKNTFKAIMPGFALKVDVDRMHSIDHHKARQSLLRALETLKQKKKG